MMYLLENRKIEETWNRCVIDFGFILDRYGIPKTIKNQSIWEPKWFQNRLFWDPKRDYRAESLIYRFHVEFN